MYKHSSASSVYLYLIEQPEERPKRVLLVVAAGLGDTSAVIRVAAESLWAGRGCLNGETVDRIRNSTCDLGHSANL